MSLLSFLGYFFDFEAFERRLQIDHMTRHIVILERIAKEELEYALSNEKEAQEADEECEGRKKEGCLKLAKITAKRADMCRSWSKTCKANAEIAREEIVKEKEFLELLRLGGNLDKENVAKVRDELIAKFAEIDNQRSLLEFSDSEDEISDDSTDDSRGSEEGL